MRLLLGLRLPLLSLCAAAVIAFPRRAETGEGVTLESFIADVSVLSPDALSVTFTFNFLTNGAIFKGFKLSNEKSFYWWSRDGMYCVMDGDAKHDVTRVPREDGLTSVRPKERSFLKGKAATCVLTGVIDPARIEEILSGDEPDYYGFSLELPAPTMTTRALSVSVHFPNPVAEEDLVIGDMTAEEFGVQIFASAVTFSASGVAPRQYKTLEFKVRRSALAAAGARGTSKEPQPPEVRRHTGIKRRFDRIGSSAAHVLGFSLLLFLLLVVKGSGDARRGAGSATTKHLFFPGIGAAARAMFTLCLIMLFAVLTLSGVFLEAVLLFAWAVVLQITITARPWAIDREHGALGEAGEGTEPAAQVKTEGVAGKLFNIKGFAGFLSFVVYCAISVIYVWFLNKTSILWSLNLGFASLACLLHLFGPVKK